MSKEASLQLNPGEKEIIHLHRHPIVLFFEIIPFILLLAMPPVLWIVVQYLGFTISDSPIITLALTCLGSLYYMIISLLLLYSYFDFVLDMWIVTTERVINVEQVGLFNRAASEQEIPKIQDITAQTKGFFPTIFNYGNVYVQTAAEKEHFVFKDVKKPQEVVSIISRVIDMATKHETEKSSP